MICWLSEGKERAGKEWKGARENEIWWKSEWGYQGQKDALEDEGRGTRSTERAERRKARKRKHKAEGWVLGRRWGWGWGRGWDEVYQVNRQGKGKAYSCTSSRYYGFNASDINIPAVIQTSEWNQRSLVSSIEEPVYYDAQGCSLWREGHKGRGGRGGEGWGREETRKAGGREVAGEVSRVCSRGRLRESKVLFSR